MRAGLVATLLIAAIGFFAETAQAHVVSGVVSDASGAPLDGAVVWLSVARESRTMKTGADGAFSFPDVPTAQVQLVAYKDGFALGGANGQCVADSTIKLALAPSLQAGHVRVVNERFEPIEGAAIRRMDLPGAFSVYVEDLAPLGFPVKRSDPNGALSLPPLQSGTFVTVVIGHPDYADALLPALPSDIGITDDLDVPLPDGIPVAGRITDEKGNGVARARVSLYQSGEQNETILVTEALTSRDGFYKTVVAAGKYFVAARHPDFAMPAPKAVQADELSGRAIADLTLPAGHRMVGRALDTEGAPVPLAIFSYRTNNLVVAETVSDRAGHFELLVPAGQGSLHVRPPRRMATVKYPALNVHIGDEAVVDLSTIEFRAAPTLKGRITAAAGEPLDKIIVTALNLDQPVAVIPNAQGEFSIELEAVPDQPLLFRAEHALRFLRQDFAVDPEKLTLPDLELREFKPEPPKADGPWPNDIKPLVGQPAPDFSARTWFNLPGGAADPTLASLRGKVVVLMLWAGFDQSPSNLQHIAEMNALASLYAGVDDVAVISIHDGATPPEGVERYIHQLNVAFPVGCDSAENETFKRYRTGVVPQVILIDKTGKVRFYQTDGRLLELIKMLRRE